MDYKNIRAGKGLDSDSDFYLITKILRCNWTQYQFWFYSIKILSDSTCMSIYHTYMYPCMMYNHLNSAKPCPNRVKFKYNYTQACLNSSQFELCKVGFHMSKKDLVSTGSNLFIKFAFNNFLKRSRLNN